MTVASPGQMRMWNLTAATLYRDDPTTWSAEEQGSFLIESQRLINMLIAMQHEVTAAFDAAGSAQQLGARSSASWLRAEVRLTEQQAGAQVHTARALRDDLPETSRALADGDISLDHVHAIRKGHRRLGDAFTRIERIVADYARGHNATQTRRLVASVIDQYDPSEADEQAEQQHEKRYAYLSLTSGGWWRLDGLLDPACGEKLKAALDVYAGRAGDDDERIPKQRRCDALGELADRALATIDRVSGSGTVTLTLTAEQLATGHDVAWPHGLLVSRADLAIHTCTASVTYVIGHPTHDPIRWQPLAVGFAERFATPAQRRALAVRDGGCIHPGCEVSPERCIAHHIVHWDKGGATDLPNLWSPLTVVLFHEHNGEHHRSDLRPNQQRSEGAARRCGTPARRLREVGPRPGLHEHRGLRGQRQERLQRQAATRV